VAAIWRVYTLALAAEILGETEDRIHDAGIDMPPEEGCLTVYGPGDAETMAFTEDGLENLKDYRGKCRNPSTPERCVPSRRRLRYSYSSTFRTALTARARVGKRRGVGSSALGRFASVSRRQPRVGKPTCAQSLASGPRHLPLGLGSGCQPPRPPASTVRDGFPARLQTYRARQRQFGLLER